MTVCGWAGRRKPPKAAGTLAGQSASALRAQETSYPKRRPEARDTGPDDCRRVTPKRLAAGAAAQVFITSGGAQRHDDRAGTLAGQSASARGA